MPTFVIPTKFTAVDKFSGPVKGMGNALDSFAMKAEAGVARSERMFRKLTPTLSTATKELLSFASSAAITGAAFAGAAFSGKALVNYETELANLQAVTGVAGKEFDTFKVKIRDVSNETKSSAVDVAKAFTAIANNQPELLKSADALAAVTKSSIILAQASKMELQPAGEALTQILNQFGLGANDAAKTIDQLAAGSVAGSSEIRDSAAAIQQFGVVAKNAGIKLNESVALIELGSKFDKGVEAGVKFRNILLTMSAIKVQDPKALADLKRLGVDLDIVSNAALPLKDRLLEMGKISKDNAALFHVFGKENQAMATGILSSADNFDTMLTAVNTTGKATEMAAVNNKTLAISLEQLKNKFVTWLVTSEQASKALNRFRKIAVFVADNLDTILNVVGLLIGAFASWWLYIKISTFAIKAMQLVSNLFFLVDMVKYVAATRGISFAQAAWAIVVESATGAMAALNAVMLANPIGLAIIAIAVMIGLVIVITRKWNEWGAALSVFLGPIGMVISAIQAFRRNWEMIKESFSTGGIIGVIKAIGKTILDSLLMPIQQLLNLLAKIPGHGFLASGANAIQKVRNYIGSDSGTDESGNPMVKEIVNTKAASNKAIVDKLEQTNNAHVGLTIENSSGSNIRTNNPNGVNIVTTSTMPVWGK